MKVLKHGRHFTRKPPVNCKCACGCEMEVDEGDMEGNTTPFVWCPECKEPVYLSVRLVARFVQ